MEKENGLVIGEVWVGEVDYNVKIHHQELQLWGLGGQMKMHIIEVKSGDIEKIENPLNEEGVGW